MESARYSLSTLLIALLLVTAAGARSTRKAQRTITADIPFDFMIDQSMFPAGHYVVTQHGQQRFHLQANAGLESASFTIQPSPTFLIGHGPRMVFDENNGHIQLSEVWINSQTGGILPGRRALQVRTVGRSRIEVEAECIACQ